MKMRPSENYVLKPFPRKYKELVSEIIENAIDGINHYLQYGINSSMNRYNKKDDNNGE